MIFAKGFFDLQFSFAERVSELSGTELETVLLEYTNFHVRFGLGRDFNPDGEGWRAYLAGLREAGDPREWTYRFYLRDPEQRTAPAVAATVGCFSYAVPDGTHVRLHFRNTEDEARSPLGSTQIPKRRAELAAIFAHMKGSVGSDTPVIGASWLYNLRAYRRLFPPSYVSAAAPFQGAFHSMGLWGQFLDRRGEVRASMAEPFMKAVAETQNLERVGECFPFCVLRVSAPARDFYEFYEV